jgi:RHS repeat-associated protein
LTTTFVDPTLDVTYHYDEEDGAFDCGNLVSIPVGHLTRVVESSVTTTYCYDVRGNVVQKRQVQGAQTDTTTYAYTLADRLSQVTYPSGTVVQYTRNNLGQITSVTSIPSGGSVQTLVSNVTYLPFGPVSGYTLGNGQVVSRNYDANYQLADLTSPNFNLHFTRDVMGDITSLGKATGVPTALETYTYDPLYRLTGVLDSQGNVVESYTYNKTGDRLSKASTGGLATGTYGYQPGTHWLTSIGSAARSYDLNGNTTGNATGGQSFGFGYDGRNRLIVAQANNVTVGAYTYNALGERVAKATTSPQVNERFVYDEDYLILGEYGTSSRDYVWMDELPIAILDGSGPTSSVNFVVADGLGTPRSVANSSGIQIWNWTYQDDPFGEKSPTSMSSFLFNPRFLGQYYDGETGLTYNINRYYDAGIGRYAQTDPIALAGGSSTYAYVGGNPLSYIDPLGLKYAESWAAGGAIAGGTIVAGGSVVVDVYTGGLNIAATGPEIAGGSAIGGGIGYVLGSALDWATGNTQQSTGLPPGYWPADTGAAEWGRRTGVGAREGKGRFHGIKQGCPGSKATDVFGVDPKTGDVVDPTGEVVGNLDDVKSK